MGLDCTHEAWHGSYGAFNRWRERIAKAAKIPLPLMEGFFGFEFVETDPEDLLKGYRGENVRAFSELVRAAVDILPIQWESLRPSPLHALLNHSDCDGDIPAEQCGPIADALEELMPLLDGDGGGHVGNYRDKTRTFINGLRAAAAANEPLGFY
jgi:hypothetical protein